MRYRDLAVSFSLAHFLFYRVFADVCALLASQENHYYLKSLPSIKFLGALYLNIALYCILFYVLTGWARDGDTRRGRLAQCVLALCSLLAFSWVVKVEAGINAAHLKWLAPAAASVVAAAAAFLLWWRPLPLQEVARRTGRFAYRILLVLAVAALALSGRLVWRVAEAKPIAAEQATLPTSPAAVPAAPSRAPIVVLLFDEADYRLLFKNRPAGLQLPMLDRLVQESVLCENAYPPSGCTLCSLPALLNGVPVYEAVSRDADTLLLYGPEHRLYGDWKRLPSVFSELGSAGVRCGMTGWAHPYGRIFGGSVATWCEMPSQLNSVGESFPEMAVKLSRSVLETKRYSPLGQSLMTQQALANYLRMRADLESMIRQRYGFIFAHLPVPHQPHFYNAALRDYTLGNSNVSGYVNSLALMDRAIGEVIAQLQETGVYRDCTLIITSDHWWRMSKKLDGGEDHRVPFLVKLPGQQRGYRYQRKFNTVIMKELVVELAHRRQCQPQELAAWLDVHAPVRNPVVAPGQEE